MHEDMDFNENTINEILNYFFPHPIGTVKN